MIVSSRIRRRLRTLIALVPTGACLALAYYWIQNLLEGEVTNLERLPGIAAIGATVVFFAGTFELIYLPSRPGAWLRRKPFLFQLVIRLIVMWFAILAGLALGNALFNPATGIDYATGSPIIIDAIVTFALALMILLFLQMRDLVGPGVLGAFVLGRYFRPVNEFRVFMFLDLANSTSIAERLGDEGMHAIISQFFFDIAAPILEHEGQTHRYIGDEVVVTWREQTAFKKNNCVQTILSIEDELALHRDVYQKRFGLMPEFRVALHCGMIAAGECGEDKREIVFFGDTINTTARIQSMCRTLERKFLISDALRARLEEDDRFTTESMGEHALRGKTAPMQLFAVHRAAP